MDEGLDAEKITVKATSAGKIIVSVAMATLTLVASVVCGTLRVASVYQDLRTDIQDLRNEIRSRPTLEQSRQITSEMVDREVRTVLTLAPLRCDQQKHGGGMRCRFGDKDD